MVSINYATREVSCKIVFYGPGLSGKTTNLQYVHQKVPSNTKGKLISLATDADRTLYFDFLPINIGTINGFASKFQLYTVPGQVYYNATRKLVLRGVDGLVFVADSQPDKMDENIESLNNLKENLAEYGYKINELPIVIQYNKQDLPNVLSPDEMRQTLNPHGWPEFKASATEGFGVFDTLKCILKLVLEKAKAGGTAPSAQPISPGEATTASAPPPPPSGMNPPAAQPAEVAPPAVQQPTPPPVQPAPPPAQPTPVPVQAAPPPAPPAQPVTPMAPAAQQLQPQPVSQNPTAPGDYQLQPESSVSTQVSTVPLTQQPTELARESVPEAAPLPSDTQPVYRPFPGNAPEHEQSQNDAVPPSVLNSGSEQNYAGNTALKYDQGVNTQVPKPTGSPQMAPSLKADRPRKKRSFFKRLFGLK